MRLLVGTVGQSVLMSDDGDNETWQRLGPRTGMHSDGVVRTLRAHPDDARVVFAGTDRGIMRSDDGGSSWRMVDGVLGGSMVWSLAFHPVDRHVMFAGTGVPRATIVRSIDGGGTWQELDVDIAAECDNVGIPRVIDLAVDPGDPRHVWAAIEVDGIRHSADGGETWTRVDASAIPNPDGHSVAVAAGPPKTVFVTVNNEVYLSQDDGATWHPVGARERFGRYRHVRTVKVDPFDPCAAWVTVGDATPGDTGALMRTTDLGRTWQTVQMPVEPNSAMWVLQAQPDSRDLLIAASRYGYLYRSDDHGQSWRKLRRELSEIASILWVP